MTPGGTAAQMTGVLATLGLAAFAWFVLPGQDGPVAVTGVVVGLLLVLYTFDGDQFAGATIPMALARIIVTAGIGFAIPWIFAQEIGRSGLGGMGVGLITMAHAIGGMMWGVALGMLWNARKLLK